MHGEASDDCHQAAAAGSLAPFLSPPPDNDDGRRQSASARQNSHGERIVIEKDGRKWASNYRSARKLAAMARQLPPIDLGLTGGTIGR